MLDPCRRDQLFYIILYTCTGIHVEGEKLVSSPHAHTRYNGPSVRTYADVVINTARECPPEYTAAVAY